MSRHLLVEISATAKNSPGQKKRFQKQKNAAIETSTDEKRNRSTCLKLINKRHLSLRLKQTQQNVHIVRLSTKKYYSSNIDPSLFSSSQQTANINETKTNIFLKIF